MSTELRAAKLVSFSDFKEKLSSKDGLEGEAETRMYVGNLLWLWLNFNVCRYYTGDLSEEKVHVRLYPVAAGLIAMLPVISCLSLYGGLGVSYSVRTWNQPLLHASCQGFRGTSWGGVGKSGLLLSVTNNIFIDFFADYYYPKVSFVDSDYQVSSARPVRVGIGVGICY